MFNYYNELWLNLSPEKSNVEKLSKTLLHNIDVSNSFDNICYIFGKLYYCMTKLLELNCVLVVFPRAGNLIQSVPQSWIPSDLSTDDVLKSL